MFPSIGAQGKRDLITINRMELGDIGVMAKAPEGGGDYGGTFGWDWEDSPRPKVLALLGGGSMRTSRG